MDLAIVLPEAMSDSSNIIAESLIGYDCIKNSDLFALYDVLFYSGGFCQAYPLKKNGVFGKKCLRLWWQEMALDRQQCQISAVSKFFATQYNSNVIKYHYEPNALRVNGSTILSGIVMDWVEGDTLLDYVRKNYQNRNALLRVAKSFFDMVIRMNQQGISHGDLSAENIIVKPSGELCLIDYDSFYVPSMYNLYDQNLRGTKGYQHPQRICGPVQKMSAKDDFFSQQVIYLSLLSIADNPNLYKERDKCILFPDTVMVDVKSFTNSSIYKSILSSKNEEICARLEILSENMKGNISDVQPLTRLDECIFNRGISVAEIQFRVCGKSQKLNIYPGMNTFGTFQKISKTYQQVTIPCRRQGDLFRIEETNGNFRIYDLCGNTKRANGRDIPSKGISFCGNTAFNLFDMYIMVMVPEIDFLNLI